MNSQPKLIDVLVQLELLVLELSGLRLEGQVLLQHLFLQLIKLWFQGLKLSLEILELLLLNLKLTMQFIYLLAQLIRVELEFVSLIAELVNEVLELRDFLLLSVAVCFPIFLLLQHQIMHVLQSEVIFN